MKTKSLTTGCIFLLLMSVAVVTPCFAGNTICACSQKFTGILRMVSCPAHCLRGETAVSWDITGPQGPPGVANGISAAVHGTVGANGVKVSGEGFTVAPALPGGGVPDVTITFDPPFQQPPDCTATSLDPSFYFCMIYALTKESFNVFCASPDVTGGILQFHTTGGPFSFICVH